MLYQKVLHTSRIPSEQNSHPLRMQFPSLVLNQFHTQPHFLVSIECIHFLPIQVPKNFLLSSNLPVLYPCRILLTVSMFKKEKNNMPNFCVLKQLDYQNLTSIQIILSFYLNAMIDFDIFVIWAPIKNSSLIGMPNRSINR